MANIFNTDYALPQKWAFDNLMSLRVLFDMLVWKTRENPRVCAVYKPLLQAGEQLVVLCCDANPHYLATSTDHNLQRETYDEYHKGNVVKEMVITDLDGDVVLLLPLLASISPVCGDGNIMICQAQLEQNNNVTKGFVTLLTGLPGYHIILLLDKGFKKHRFNPQHPITFLDFCHRIPGLHAFVPLDPGDQYLDSQLQPGGLPDPAIGRNKRLTCREANTSRTVVSMGHSAVEMSFGEQAQWGMSYKKEFLPPRMMKPIGGLCLNASEQPRLFIVLYALFVLKNRYHQPNHPTFSLPAALTYRDIGLAARNRLPFRNPLDPLEGVQWDNDPF